MGKRWGWRQGRAEPLPSMTAASAEGREVQMLVRVGWRARVLGRRRRKWGKGTRLRVG